jgi:hypothetical protein
MQKKKLALGAIVAIVPVLVIVGLAAAGGGQSSVADLRQATAAYHDLDAANAAGYTVELAQTDAYGGGTCIDGGSAGAMGIHLLSPSRIDGNLVPTEPEALLYERRNDGSLKLTGVEYIVAGGPQPTLYGQQFADTNLGRYGDPNTNVWTLHAWVWKPNPSEPFGIFSPWNPRVSCN